MNGTIKNAKSDSINLNSQSGQIEDKKVQSPHTIVGDAGVDIDQLATDLRRLLDCSRTNNEGNLAFPCPANHPQLRQIESLCRILGKALRVYINETIECELIRVVGVSTQRYVTDEGLVTVSIYSHYPEFKQQVFDDIAEYFEEDDSCPGTPPGD